ncbi:transketolase-like TK C-terminal-containing protein [Salipaludibacillus aurantiacus]|uniref:transketolase-like TK C-terminal-containing protein n=1 Tax=Salipaludibacillus aurantiacus TaxID=1601833 RepID=UPI003CCBE554
MSEAQLALQAQRELAKENLSVSVINFPSWDLFESQSKDYQESVLPSHVKARLAIEMNSTLGWERYEEDHGDVLGINLFWCFGPTIQGLGRIRFYRRSCYVQSKRVNKSLN